MQRKLLGGLTPRAFLARYWQKRLLFVRRAIAAPEFVDERALTALARRDDVESRIVHRRGTRRETAHGPFTEIKPKRSDWTILVNGVNHHVAAADALLRRFGFVPQARRDDVMVSYATPGGGVGPHVDSYDVFLIQGPGRRRWTVGGRTFIAEPGDLLYLPPGREHDGVALEPCYTYSVGFRAPRGAELAAAFLDFLHKRGLPDAAYRDADLRPAQRSAAIPAAMLRFAGAIAGRIRWSSTDIRRFVGEYLTLPKPHVVFRPERARGSRLCLDARSQLLYAGSDFFLNGDRIEVPARARAAMRELADRREIDASRLAALPVGEWRRAGYVHLRQNLKDG
jgi:50S ribosomal protein L16 3-hydroxylase